MGFWDRFQACSRRAAALAFAALGIAGALPPGARAQAAADPAALVFDLRSHSGPVRRLAVDARGEWAVTASDDKTALVWNLASGRVQHTLRVPVGEDEIGRLYGAAISPDGRTVAVGGSTGTAGGPNRVYLFDLASGAFRSAFDARTGGVRHLAWSADGRLLAAAYVPGNGIKARVHHPMVLGVKVWALAHLLANHTLADLLLFGGFLVWAVLCFRAARQRDRAAGTVYPPGSLPMTLVTVVAGTAAWAGFSFWAHAAWIGVRPFG